MTNATITVQVGEAKRGFEIRDIDFDLSYRDLALKIGEAVVDAIWEEVEG